MTMMLELLDGSYDLLFLSLYISLIVATLMNTIWCHMVQEPSRCMASRHIDRVQNQKESNLSPSQVEPVNEMIQWLQRTVCRKDCAGDDADHLFIR